MWTIIFRFFGKSFWRFGRDKLKKKSGVSHHSTDPRISMRRDRLCVLARDLRKGFMTAKLVWGFSRIVKPTIMSYAVRCMKILFSFFPTIRQISRWMSACEFLMPERSRTLTNVVVVCLLFFVLEKTSLPLYQDSGKQVQSILEPKA